MAACLTQLLPADLKDKYPDHQKSNGKLDGCGKQHAQPGTQAGAAGLTPTGSAADFT
jgi:hypothetical protein